MTARWWGVGGLLRPSAWIGAALLGLAAGACTSAPRVVPSPHDPGAGAPTPTLRGYHGWWSRIAEIMERELGFPRLDTVLFLYPHQRALEQALVRDGMPPDLARRAASTLDAVGRAGKVMANESSFRSLRWPQRVLVLGHELTHSAQYSLSGGRRGSSEQWLREGFAEWVAWRVAESLQMGTVARHRHRAAARVLAATRTHSLPPLAELRSGHDLLAQLARHRQAPIYDQAFLAADLLIAEHGAARVVEYFRLFAEDDDREANFRRVFGESHAAFVERFARHLAAL
ncbi:MAG: hypothetical protein AB2L07_17625 [Thermoanaerobaculaceae bacterium]